MLKEREMYYKTEKNWEKHFRIIQFEEKDFEKKLNQDLTNYRPHWIPFFSRKCMFTVVV